MKIKIKTYIVVLNWNGKNIILDCLNSLTQVKSNASKLEIVVVDNNSSDNSVKIIKEKFPKIKIIENKKNLGFSGGNNTGIKYALKNGADCVLLLNPDTIVNDNFIDPLLSELFSNKNIGIVGPKIYKYPLKSKIISSAGNNFDKNFLGKDLGTGRKDKGQFNKIRNVDYVTGTAMLVKKEVFERAGILDDIFFLYYEDLDFCLRVKKAGFVFKYVPESIISHKGSVTTIVGSPIHTYYNARNRLLFLMRYLYIAAIIKEFKKDIKILIRFIVKQRDSDKYALYGVRDFLLGRFGKRIYW